MTIAEMHVWFRQYAQQMGMQNVRAILPEQIDLLINSSITDTVNQVIAQNVNVTNDRVITDNSKIGQINALSYLYKTGTINAKPVTSGSGEMARPFVADKQHPIYSQSAELYKFTPGGFTYLYLVDFAIEYELTNNKLTNWFPVRIIEDRFLADTLNDFILKPTVRSPICVIYNDKLDLYIDNATYEDNTIHLPYGLTPSRLRVSFIDIPAKVAYRTDVYGDNVNCDLPEYMHVDILKHAVDLYRIAVNGGMYSAQQQQQAQNRELARNVARPDNEGYKS